MKKSALISISSAILLGGCAHHRPDHDKALDPSRPRVFVVDGRQIVVSPDPLVFPYKQGKVEITWVLPKESPYTFPVNGGIEIEGRLASQKIEQTANGGKTIVYVLERQNDITACRRIDPKEFSCTYVIPESKRWKYKYTIRVEGGNTKLEPLDPWIIP